MKKILTILTLTVGVSSLALAQQNQTDTTNRSKPLIDDKTQQNINRTANQASQRVEAEISKSMTYQERNQLSWFQPGNLFAGGGLGFGATDGQVYADINTRVGYFFQPGFAAGLRFDADQLVAKKYHARQIGAFARYYPFRTRISSFVGASLNSGREFAESIPADTKSKYTSVGIELGVMAWILHRLGAEIAYESSFYNKIDPSVSRGKGGRLKFGINYYFGRIGQRGIQLAH